MGVPVFFKWMCMRNPKMLKDAIQPQPDSPVSPNPPIDNFYVDMNGLIHPSVNPKQENIRVPSNFQEQCENIFMYIDKIMNIVRPKRLLYLAIDGVAPRAKMNQQRSRRFRAAMQSAQNETKKRKLLEQYKQKYNDVSQIQQYINKKSFDSNLITPGTTFLWNVGLQIRAYIKERIQNHPLWKNITVIFSDASCPGEGEHKIMEFIRQQRASNEYDPNQIHCIYGADADLIMLGLATHEPRFFIIREVVITVNDKWCTNCGKKGHYFTDCRTATSIQNQQIVAQEQNAESIKVNFQFLNLKLVRQYLHIHFKIASVPFGYDLERIIDDFVFLCFFVGNDFLPHVPCLTIRQGGIDILMRVYEYCLGIMPDYITFQGKVQHKSLKVFINQMKQYQNEVVKQIIFKQSQAKQKEQRMKEINKQKDDQMFEQKPSVFTNPLNSFKEEYKKLVNFQNNLENYSVFGHQIYGYKEKYYREKFRITPQEFVKLRRSISVAYVQALSWINLYYYKGVSSWSWFYPFHYSPFFSDIFVEQQPTFQLGQPFKPFEQLMAVLPPKTCQALPKFLQQLMLKTTSPIADYFPCSFEIDLVGKKFAWLGEVLLPFIDENRLLNAMSNYKQHLNQDQQTRNTIGVASIYTNNSSSLGRLLTKVQVKNIFTQIRYSQFNIQGQVKQQSSLGNVSEWHFIPPAGRNHSIKLKQGIHFSLLEDLQDDFARNLDKKSYSGERFIRIIQRSLGNRLNQIRGHSRRRDQRSRSREREDHRNRSNERRYDDYRGNRHRNEPRDRDRQRREYRDQRERERRY